MCPAGQPSRHALGAVLPLGDSFPAGQAWQALCSTAPVASLQKPASHRSHATLPAAATNVPAWHETHADMPLPAAYLPAEQRAQEVSLPLVVTFPASHSLHTSSCVAAKAVADFPAAHELHPALPTASLYLPAAHALQAPPLPASYPALHSHAPEEEEAAGDVECVGQAVHAPADVAATSEEYVPWAQSEHADGPTVSLNCPAGQLEHVPPSGPLKPWLQRQA